VFKFVLVLFKSVFKLVCVCTVSVNKLSSFGYCF
jgi:hypothetical protein